MLGFSSAFLLTCTYLPLFQSNGLAFQGVLRSAPPFGVHRCLSARHWCIIGLSLASTWQLNQNHCGIPQLLTASDGPVVFQSFHVRLRFEAALLWSQTPCYVHLMGFGSFCLITFRVPYSHSPLVLNYLCPGLIRQAWKLGHRGNEGSWVCSPWLGIPNSHQSYVKVELRH